MGAWTVLLPSLTLVLEFQLSAAQQTRAEGGEAAERLRATLLATSLGRPLTVALHSGETLEGTLADVADDSFALWVTADGETRRRLGLVGARIKRSIHYEEVERIQGAGDKLGESAQLIPANSAEGLAYRMRVGDTMYVRTEKGEDISGRLDDFDGEILRLDDRTLSLSGASGDKVERIDLKVDDSLKNGILIGTAIGAGLGTLGAVGCSLSDSPEDLDCGSGTVIAVVAFYSAVGAAFGALFDGLTHRRLPVYVAPAVSSEPQLRIGPILSRDRRGLFVSWSF